MAGSIKFGNKFVPIVETFVYETTVGSTYPSINDYSDSIANLFSKGVTAATAEDPARDSGSNPSQEVSLRTGKTYMANGGLLHVWQDFVSHTYGNDVTAHVWFGTPEDDHEYPSFDQQSTYTFGFDGVTYYDYVYTTNIVGGRFMYNAETDPELRVYGYHIMFIRQTTTYDNNGHYVGTEYNLVGSNIYLLIPQLNKANGTDYYIEEDVTPDPDNPFDPSEPEDYGPPGDDSSDVIPIPTNPPIGVTGSGFIHVYNPAMGTLQGLGDVIFPSPVSSSDVATMLLTLCETIANSNLINYIIDCHVIPTAPTIGSSQEIMVGYRRTGINAPVVVSDYVDVSCGVIQLAEFYRGFQDYQGTSAKLYLPFIGFVDMKPEFWQAGTLGVDYKFNVIDGSFMCYIRSTSSKSKLAGSVIAQFSGNACMHFPITGVNYAAMVSGIVGAVTQLPTGKTMPSSADFSKAATIISQGGNVQQSNGYNSTSCILGVRTPYLMIERVMGSVPSYYNHDKGYPSNITTQLARVSGYTEIEDIDLSGIPLTEGELNELRSLLKEGVYF